MLFAPGARQIQASKAAARTIAIAQMNYSATGTPLASSEQRLKTLQRRPVRITITISHALHESLLLSSDEQGRSLSNLAAYLLETANAANGQTGGNLTHLGRVG